MSDFYQENWACWHTLAFEEIGLRREFTGETLRVLFILMGNLERRNRIVLAPEEVAEKLGIRKDHVVAQMKKLADAGVLIQRKKWDWRLSPNYGFKGEPDKDLRRISGKLELVE